jgi:hypothetical protein
MLEVVAVVLKMVAVLGQEALVGVVVVALQTQTVSLVQLILVVEEAVAVVAMMVLPKLVVPVLLA